jgi:hypothetical protein
LQAAEIVCNVENSIAGGDVLAYTGSVLCESGTIDQKGAQVDMSKLRTTFVSLLIAALVALGATGCGDKESHEHPQGEHPSSEHPSSEHPAGEHPSKEEGAEEKSADETPAKEHPAGEHPSGEHPK